MRKAAKVMRKAGQSLNIDELKAFAPAVFATEAHSSTSDKYAFIPTSALLEPMRDLHYVPVEVRVKGTRRDDHRGFETHVLRFREEKDVAAPVGATVSELMLFNSHDLSSSFQVMSGLFRTACTNGMVIPIEKGLADQYKLRHVDLTVDAAIDMVNKMITKGQLAWNSVDKFKNFNMLPEEIEKFAKDAIELRWPNNPSRVLPEYILRPNREEDVGNDAWHVLNRVQENLIKGVQGTVRGADGKKARVRGINGIDADLTLNKGIWQLAEDLVTKRI